LATASLLDTPPAAETKRTKRRSTSHLKLVPETKELREQLRAKCQETAARLDKSQPLGKDQMEAVARGVLEQVGLPEGYVGWTMVVLATAFWHDQVAAVPHNRRLFLLPHCLKHAEGCPADYDEFGLDCRKCGACSIADFRTLAEDLGYRVLVAEGSPIVLKIIVSGYVDAIVGVACLNVLEKAIDKILLAGIPCMAVPLLSSDCRNTGVDEEWVLEMIKLEHRQPPVQTRSYLHLMRGAAGMFEEQELNRLAPRLRGGPSLAQANNGHHGVARSEHDAKGVGATNGHALRIPAQGVPPGLDPIAATEAIAHDFLAKGGKHSRPFITLAVYDALTGGQCTAADGAERVAAIPNAVKRCAMSIETFHKASLVHDDIEDDDQFRYGDETLHRRYGIPTAINIGDFLIGLGYRLISRETSQIGAEAAADILDRMADAHLKLSEGQGAELLWRDSLNKQLAPLDALKIYALKTAPAFEAALYTGARLAVGRATKVGHVSNVPDQAEQASGTLETCPTETCPTTSITADEFAALREPISQFARHLGVAFQILNDLNDWRGDHHNKLSAGGDVLGGRPTVLWALALEGLADADRAELQSLVEHRSGPPGIQDTQTVHRVRTLYDKAGVFEKAQRLVEKYRQRAEAVADAVAPDELRRLFYYLVDTVLDRPVEESSPEPAVISPETLTLTAVS
jgi:geranylgeranyl pyrophosphate synthase